ncbi:hypothetical protein BVRB_028970, partial [Beta vulgaris subsp. vulgaris]
MRAVCPWRYLIVASDQPDLLPSAAFIKHHILGIEAVVDLDTDLIWIAPDATPCRLHLSGRHWSSAIPIATNRGLVVPDTAIYICRRPHRITAQSNVDDAAQVELAPG